MPDISNIFAFDDLGPYDVPRPGFALEQVYFFGDAGGGDPPEVSGLTPSEMSTVARNQVHSFDFTDDGGDFTTIIVAVGYPSGRWDFVYNGSSFMPDYSGSSITPIANGFHLEIARNGGWLELGALKMFVEGVDTFGQSNSNS